MSLAVPRVLLGPPGWGVGCPGPPVPSGLLPEEAVGRGAAVSDVVEENLQLLVIVKVSCNDGADGGRHGELGGGDVLREGWAWGDKGHREQDTRSRFGASGPLLTGT